MFTAPVFSAFQSLAAYGLVREVKGSGAGLLAALFSGIVPSYISRSVAGSFDNEGVAIFALLFVFYLFVKVCLSQSVASVNAMLSVTLFIGVSTIQFLQSCSSNIFIHILK